MRIIRQISRDKIAALCLFMITATLLAGIFAPIVAPNDPQEVHMELRFAAPSWEYGLGNDQLGRCILSRLIYGIRPSVLWVLAALAISVGIGTMVGLVAGYFRGVTDAILMRICDIMLSFPGYVMVLATIAILGVGLESILVAFILMKWAWFARMIRATVMQLTDTEYVMFSKAIGQSSMKIMMKHIVPVSLPDIAVISSSSFGSMIMQISGFSFLGLGIQAPGAEWGMMLNEARAVMFSRPELMLAPGIAIITLVSAVNFLSDALQTALDPKLATTRYLMKDEAYQADRKLQAKEVI
ncbi:nickel/cobalt ABC transporter permease [Paenibacillus sp. YPG26]|uniref:staphylopine uptake ABC transporter permease subunit CntC n=1 Tax=Paenibacillus sp. YPG26 TaxID=2878915 RepID=UPI00203ED818|nr:nickel/cobalt ABC transporter permease [Paenibacillus sp. YPG26]USB31760.1 ABC transporter permease [Paenibacillus sp. YPG26]